MARAIDDARDDAADRSLRRIGPRQHPAGGRRVDGDHARDSSTGDTTLETDADRTKHHQPVRFLLSESAHYRTVGWFGLSILRRGGHLGAYHSFQPRRAGS